MSRPAVVLRIQTGAGPLHIENAQRDPGGTVGATCAAERCSSVVPDVLLGDATTDGVADRLWWLIYTRSRQEKVLAEHLEAHQVPFYLPLVERKSLSRGRTRIAHVPLFTGYVFLYGTVEERVIALKSNRISTTQQVIDGETLRTDLRQIAELIALGAPLTPEARLAPGKRVRVKGGKFVGYEGTVLQRAHKTRLLIAVNFLQQGASLEIDDHLLEAI